MFCTACGTRISAPNASAPDVGVSGNNLGRPVSDATDPPPNASHVSESNTADKIADTSAVAVVPDVITSPNVTSSADNAVPTVPSANQSAAAPAMAVMSSASTSSLPMRQPQNVSRQLGGSSSAPKPGIFVIVVLILIVAAATAILFMRPSGQKPGHVIILTPQRTSLTVEPNETSRLSVSVQGDSGAGLTWKIAESYGGTVQPAGVTVRGSQFLYHAVYHAGGTPGDYHIVASSAANRDSSITIQVHVER